MHDTVQQTNASGPTRFDRAKRGRGHGGEIELTGAVSYPLQIRKEGRIDRGRKSDFAATQLAAALPQQLRLSCSSGACDSAAIQRACWCWDQGGFPGSPLPNGFHFVAMNRDVEV